MRGISTVRLDCEMQWRSDHMGEADGSRGVPMSLLERAMADPAVGQRRLIQFGAAVSRSLVALLIALVLANEGQAAKSSEPVTGRIKSEFGCELTFEVYEPHGAPALKTIVLAHGFMRSLKTMRGWAEHWRAHELATVLVSFCNSHLLNGHHQRNALDLIAIRRHLELTSVIYAGFSAGGLAAYLASLKDPETAGYIGLDSVDSGRLAEDAAQALAVPALFLIADPSACNAQNNINRVIARQGYSSIEIDGATHCHFESPYAPRCSWLCGRSSSEDTERLQALIMRHATDWLLEEDPPP